MAPTLTRVRETHVSLNPTVACGKSADFRWVAAVGET